MCGKGQWGKECRLSRGIILEKRCLGPGPIAVVVRYGIEEFFTGSPFEDTPHSHIDIRDHGGRDADIDKSVHIIPEGAVSVRREIKRVAKCGEGLVLVVAARRQQVVFLSFYETFRLLVKPILCQVSGI